MIKLLICCCFIFLTLKVSAGQTTKPNATVKDSTVVNVPSRYQNCNRRNPLLAGALAVVLPTAGQIYNKQYLKAGVIWVVGIGASVGLITNSLNDRSRDGVGDAFFAVIVADVLYSIIDAPISADHLNKKYHLGETRRSFSSFHMSPALISAGAGGKPVAGFSLVLR